MTTIYFGTNRRPNRKTNPSDFGQNFSDSGLASLRFGSAQVTDNGITIKLEPERLVKDADLKQKDGKGSVLGSKAVFSDVRAKMADKSRDTVLYIHGYNVSFKEALKSAAKLKEKFSQGGNEVNVVLFSWPSDGSMMPFIAYANDRQDAAASGPAFARGALKLADFLRGSTPEEACDQRLHLVAHSMGNYVLRHALQEVIRQSPGRPPRLFDQVFLMAADEDDDAFEKDHKLKFLPRMAKRVSVYFNNDDKGMAISDKTKGNPDRLGDDGPRLPRNIPGKVSLVDASDVTSTLIDGVAQHSYYLSNPIVVKDMQLVLNGLASNKFAERDYDQETNRYRLTD